MCVCVLTECWPGSACCLKSGSWGRARCRAHALPNSRELWVFLSFFFNQGKEKILKFERKKCLFWFSDILAHPQPNHRHQHPHQCINHIRKYVWMCSYFEFSTDVCLRPWKVISVAIDSKRRPHFSLSDSTQTSDSPTCHYKQKHTNHKKSTPNDTKGTFHITRHIFEYKFLWHTTQTSFLYICVHTKIHWLIVIT